MSERIRPDLRFISALLTDTSALLAYFLGEPQAVDLRRIGGKLRLPFMALCELHYVVTRKQGKAMADQCFGLIKSWEAPILHSTEEQILAASRLKDRFNIGIGDAFIAAASLCERLPLLAYDTDFLPLAGEIELLGVQ